MQRLIWPIVAGIALALAIWARGGGGEDSAESSTPSLTTARGAPRPVSQLAPVSGTVIRPHRPATTTPTAPDSSRSAAGARSASGEPDPTSMIRGAGEVIRPDRDAIMAQRAAEARRLAQERAALMESRRSQYDQDAALRRQRELAELRQQQAELAAAQSRMLLAGQEAAQRRVRTAPTPPESNLLRNSPLNQQSVGAGGAPAPANSALAPGQQDLSDAVSAFQDQTSAQRGGGAAAPGQGRAGDGVQMGDSSIQSIIDRLTGAGFSDSTARDLVSLATGGGGGSGGAAGIIPSITTLFSGGDSSTSGGGTTTSGGSTSGGSPNGGGTTSGGSTPPASGGSGGAPNGGGGKSGGSTKPPATQPPAPEPEKEAPSVSLVGVSLAEGGVVGGAQVSASVRIVRAVAVDTTVRVSVDNAAFVSAPASVVIPAGQVSASFSVSTKPTTTEQIVRVTISVGDEARTVSLHIRPESAPPPAPEPEPAGPVIARWIHVPSNDCEDAGPINPPIRLNGFFTNDLFLGFEKPPAVAGAGSPIPLIVDSPPNVGLTIVGGDFFQHPFGGNGPPPASIPQTGSLPSCLNFDSYVTIANAAPTFLPGRSLPAVDWLSPVDAAWFTISFGSAVIEQDAAKFGDNRFYIRIARLTAPSGVRVRGALDALFPGVVDAGGVRVDIPDEPTLWGQFDLNADGLVDAGDARVLSSQLGAPPAPGAPSDLNHDGVVGERDMRLLLDAIRKQ